MIEQTPTPTPAIDPITSPEVRIPSVTPSPKKFSILPGILIGILLTSTAVFAYGYFSKIPKTAIVPLPPTTTPAPSVNSSKIPTPTPEIIHLDLGSVTWLNYPKVTNLNIFDTSKDPDNCSGAKGAKFHQTGTFSDGSKLINLIVEISCMMGGGPTLSRLIQTPSNQIYYLYDPNLNGVDYIYESLSIAFSQPILPAIVDIDGIKTPSEIDTRKGKFTIGSRFGDDIISYTELKNPILIVASDFGSFYASYQSNENLPSLVSRTIYLRLKDDTVMGYVTKIGFVFDDLVPKITWNDGTVNKDVYNYGAKGGYFGFMGEIIQDGSAVLSDKVQVGLTSENQPVFQIKNLSNQLIKLMYEHVSPQYGDTNKVSIETFASSRNHFLWEDPTGAWQLFINEKYFPSAEMAKPVIYLYPTQNTVVNVKVGADMSQSDPLYPSAGWTVLAKPSGNLTYQNQSYPYLFWEGMGWGTYPDYQNRGVVVSQQNLVRTLKSQLSQLGLNAQESADFMEFWQSKLPQTPYVRLTWLNTVDMNRLAPIAVEPRPDTVIRIFLEFEGLQQPRPLTSQALTSVPRRGFTLIEWGGLLLKGQN